MPRTRFIIGFGAVLLASTALSAQQTQDNSSQQTQAGQPAQPTPSIYNRMRRMGGGEMGQPVPETQQSQQFPGGPQQFPPEQQGTATQGQPPQMTLPQPALPTAQQAQQPTANPQNGIVAHEIVHPPAAAPGQPAQQQTPYGLALKPPNPPRITYAGGELTVAADNSSLAEILTGIDRLIGAHVEGTRPTSDRVFGQFGPGTPRAVLDSLLSGSPYDFILIGAIDDPGGVQRIMLTPHGNAALATANTETQPQSSEREDSEGATPEPEPPQPIAQPNVVSEQGQQQPAQQVKTPEQLLEELQRLRQQQQQQATSPR